MAYETFSRNYTSRLAISSHEAKIAELHSRVEEEAKKLQKVIEQKEGCVKEVESLGKRKAGLLLQIASLEQEIILASKEG